VDRHAALLTGNGNNPQLDRSTTRPNWLRRAPNWLKPDSMQRLHRLKRWFVQAEQIDPVAFEQCW